MKNRIYFASPWFTSEQEEREERLKAELRRLGFNVWSPKENCNCSPIESKEIREKVFSDNCNMINASEIVFAITDGKDMGTIWEAGYAYGKNIDVIYYCETLGDGLFNLMLAQSATMVITKFEDLKKLPDIIVSGKGLPYDGKIE